MSVVNSGLKRLVLLLVVLLFAASCGESGESGNNETNDVNADVTRAVEESTRDAVVIHQQTIDLIRVASADFTLDLTTEPAPESAIEPVANQLIELAEDRDRALADSYRLVELQYGAEQEGQQELNQIHQPLIGVLVLGGSLLLTGYVAKTGIEDAITSRNGPTRNKIVNANEAELDLVREQLELPSDADRDTILETFDGMDASTQLKYSTRIEGELATSDNSDVEEVDTEELRQATANSAVKVGETGLNTAVSFGTTATGGQGLTQAFQAAGMSAQAAQVADLVVSVVSVASGEPLQPLDRFSESMTVTAVSDETQTVEVPEPEVEMSTDEALEILEDAGASGGLGSVAVATLVRDGAVKAGAVVEEKADGTLAVEVPARVHRKLIEDVSNETTMSLPDFGLMDIWITAVDHIPQLFEDIDLSQTSTLEFEVDTGEEEPGETNNDDLSNNDDEDRSRVTCQEWAEKCDSDAMDWCEETVPRQQANGCLDELESWAACEYNADCRTSIRCDDKFNEWLNCM